MARQDLKKYCMRPHVLTVGTLKDRYVCNVPLPQVPQIQSASHELIAHKAGIPLPGYYIFPVGFPRCPNKVAYSGLARE
jgi:hypothetical protein